MCVRACIRCVHVFVGSCFFLSCFPFCNSFDFVLIYFVLYWIAKVFASRLMNDSDDDDPQLLLWKISI